MQRLAKDNILLLCGFGLIIAMTLVLRVQLAPVPFERDEGEYSYIAQRWLQGETPYVSAFDQKPPGVFAVYALFERLGATSPAAIHWATQLYTLLTLALVLWLGREWISLPAGLSAAALCSIMSMDASVLGQSSNTEIFLLLPLTAAMAASWLSIEKKSTGWGFAVGTLLALSLLFKQVSFPFFILASVLMWRFHAGWRAFAAMLSGIGLVLSLVCAYFLHAGAWAQFVECVLTYNLGYAAHVKPWEYWSNFCSGIKPILRVFWPVYVLALAALLGDVVAWFRPPGGGLSSQKRALFFMWGWLLSALIAISIGGYFRPHYFILLIPPLAFIAAAKLHELLYCWWPSRSRLCAWGLTACIIAQPLFVNPNYYFGPLPDLKSVVLYDYPIFALAAPIADLVERNSSPSDRVFVFGCEPEIYYLAHRTSVNRYIFLYPLVIPSLSALSRQKELIAALRRDPPKVLVAFCPETMMYDPHGDVTQTPPELFDQMKSLVASLPYRVIGLVPIRGPNSFKLLQDGKDVSWQTHAPAVFSHQYSVLAVIWKLQAAQAP